MTEFIAMRNGTRNGLLPGFSDPVKGAQTAFRALLQALSHPGTPVELQADATHTGIPHGLSASMTALLLTLVDGDTPLWLPADAPEAIRQFLRFHCGCPFSATPSRAGFVAVPSGFAMPALTTCEQGDPAYPDRSTTLLIEVEAMDFPDAASRREREPAFTLRGPGIEHTLALAVHGLPDDFVSQWRDNHQRFPLGVDVFFCCGLTVCGLPRTTRVEN